MPLGSTHATVSPVVEALGPQTVAHLVGDGEQFAGGAGIALRIDECDPIGISIGQLPESELGHVSFPSFLPSGKT